MTGPYVVLFRKQSSLLYFSFEKMRGSSFSYDIKSMADGQNQINNFRNHAYAKYGDFLR